MALLYLIRHARAQMTGNTADRWTLSEEGRRQARVLAHQDFWRDVGRIYSSPEPKALETARPAARRWDIPLAVADDLREPRRPRLIVDYEATIEQVFANPRKSISGLEPATEAAHRVTRCIKELSEKHAEQTLAVISHGLVMTLILSRLENRLPTLYDWRSIPFTGLRVIDTEQWQLVEEWSTTYTTS